MKCFTRVALAVVLLCFGSCAKRDTTQDFVEPPEPIVSPAPDVKPVVGSAMIGSQCEMGTIAPPVSVPMTLWECPGNFKSVTLAEALDPIYFQASCADGAISIRNIHGTKMSSDWYAMPDGSFSLVVDAPKPIVLETDGAGNKNCGLPSRIEAFGKLNCADPEHPVIDLAAQWMLGRPTNPAFTVANACLLPSSATGTAQGCYFYLETRLNQCQ